MLNFPCQAKLNMGQAHPRYARQMKTIGKRFQALRKFLGLTQDEIAAICDVTKSAVSQWESDHTKPNIENILLLRAKHIFSIDWLLTGDGDMRMETAGCRAVLMGIAQSSPPYVVQSLIKTASDVTQLLRDARQSDDKNGIH
jgi:transcriptional regulator with XRE-family HTH domain